MTLCGFGVLGPECLPVLANTVMRQQFEREAQNCAHRHKECTLPDKEMREAVIRLAPRLAISQAVIDCGDQRVNDVLTEIHRVRLAS